MVSCCFGNLVPARRKRFDASDGSACLVQFAQEIARTVDKNSSIAMGGKGRKKNGYEAECQVTAFCLPVLLP